VDRSGPGSTPTGNTSAVNSGGVASIDSSPGRLQDPNTAQAVYPGGEPNAFTASRRPLVGEFTFNGTTFFVIANHWNSKGGDEPLFGRFQPPAFNSENQRIEQARIVRDFVTSMLAINQTARIIILGDLNDYWFSRPLSILESQEGALPPPQRLANLLETLPESERYTYVFDGNSQALDGGILVSPTLLAAVEYDAVHVNAEFQDQVSDHDTQITRYTFALPSTPTPTPTSTATPTSTPTLTPTPTNTPTPTDTPVPTSTPSLTPTPTNTPLPTDTPTPTATATATPTSTATATQTAVPSDVGGKGFTLRNAASGQVVLSWTGGRDQAGYVLVRTQVPSGATRRFTLPATATSFTDAPPLPFATFCYQLLAVDRNGKTLGESDVLCVRPRTRFGSVPPNFATRLDQSELAQLTWDGVNGVTGYLLLEVPLSGQPRIVKLPASARSATDDTNGVPTCYVLFSMRGFIPLGRTDTTCVVPGQSSFGNMQSASVDDADTRLRDATRELDRPREFVSPP
jgi:hypothetical protein